MNHKVVIISEAVCHLNRAGLWGATDSLLCSAISFVLISISILWTWSPLSVVSLSDWMASSSLPRGPCSAADLAGEGGREGVQLPISAFLSETLALQPFFCIALIDFPSTWFDLMELLQRPRWLSHCYNIFSPAVLPDVILDRFRWRIRLFCLFVQCFLFDTEIKCNCFCYTWNKCQIGSEFALSDM